MKILESRPERYDTGISLLSGGHASKIKKRIVSRFVTPGMHILDVGCGTGSLLQEAVNAGATASGIDISDGMLDMAKKRIAHFGLENKISVFTSGIDGLDTLFDDESFDLVVSTLVFSELYAEERMLALKSIKKLLKPGGMLIIAVEVRPEKMTKRLLHYLVRLPLSLVTYLVAQTGTKPCSTITEEIKKSGFMVLDEERSFMDSFLLVSAKNELSERSVSSALPDARAPKDDVSFALTIWDYIGRWFPNPVEPGLRKVGNPGRASPVILTSNFHLTVRRVERSLAGEDAWLLVAPSNGINVWCGSEGGDLNTHSVITIIKTSGIKERIDHHRIILPQFSASGIDLHLLKEKTGMAGHFGPAYSKDLPAYFSDHNSVFTHNKADFSFPFRMEMLLSMNFLIWIGLLLVTWIFSPGNLIKSALSFWISGYILYAGYPFLPGNSGWLKAFLLSIAEAVAIVLFSFFIVGEPLLAHWKLMLGLTVINMVLGFDLKGIVAGEPSEAEWLMKKLGMKSMGHLFSAEKKNEGRIVQDVARCTDCRICLMVCPKGVFELVNKHKVRALNRNECFACNACVQQCNDEALHLSID